MGRSRSGLTSKIHALVDTNGLPVLARLPARSADHAMRPASAAEGNARRAPRWPRLPIPPDSERPHVASLYHRDGHRDAGRPRSGRCRNGRRVHGGGRPSRADFQPSPVRCRRKKGARRRSPTARRSGATALKPPGPHPSPSFERRPRRNGRPSGARPRRALRVHFRPGKGTPGKRGPRRPQWSRSNPNDALKSVAAGSTLGGRRAPRTARGWRCPRLAGPERSAIRPVLSVSVKRVETTEHEPARFRVHAAASWPHPTHQLRPPALHSGS